MGRWTGRIKQNMLPSFPWNVLKMRETELVWPFNLFTPESGSQADQARKPHKQVTKTIPPLLPLHLRIWKFYLATSSLSFCTDFSLQVIPTCNTYDGKWEKDQKKALWQKFTVFCQPLARHLQSKSLDLGTGKHPQNPNGIGFSSSCPFCGSSKPFRLAKLTLPPVCVCMCCSEKHSSEVEHMLVEQKIPDPKFLTTTIKRISGSWERSWSHHQAR